MHSQEIALKCLGKKDIIVVTGGSNDLDNNTEKRNSALVHMLQFVQKYTNTNIIIVSIPLRHYFAINSQINLEIQDFNIKLSKRAKLFRHVDLVELNFNRKYFTKHGFHLNNVGKEGLAKVIKVKVK
jgi:lysophospholipase L1-like esterase